MKNFNHGFTLIELIVVIAMLTVLLSITVMAINPAKNFAQAQSLKKSADLKQILDSIRAYAASNRGQLPPGIPIDAKPQEIADTGANICSSLMPLYTATLPVDQNTGTKAIDSCVAAYKTGYKIVASKNGDILVYADSATPATYRGSITQFTPAAYYKLEDAGSTITNSVGAYSNGTLFNAPTLVEGKYGKALSFTSGLATYVEIAYSPNILLDGVKGETVMFWAKHGVGQNNIMLQRNGWSRRFNSKSIIFKDNANSIYTLNFNSNTEDNLWHHVAYVYDGSKIVAYVDGDLQTQQITLPVGRVLYAANDNWWVGQSCSGATCGVYYTGLVDEVKIFSQAHNQAQVNLDAIIFE